MSIFENFEKKLQAEPKSIVFTEGTDARILLNAVVVRSRADIETFYKSYGFVYTGKFDK